MGSGVGYQQNEAATLLVEIGGTRPGSSFDQFAVGGTASLGGQLAVNFVNGFIPQPGQTFEVLTCSSLTGTFDNIITPPFAGTVLVPRYASNGVTLAVTAGLELSAPVIKGNTITFQISTAAGTSYLVQMTDEFNPTNWQTASTIAGDGTVMTISEPLGPAHRFYRVLMQ
jgi:hypothetical protein